MTEQTRKLRDQLEKQIGEAVADGTNIASAVNIGGKGKSTSVRSRQRVVHRDGETTTTTERYEERGVTE